MKLFRFTREAAADLAYLNYIIVYDPTTSPVQIIRILHGMRDIKRTLTE